MPSGRTTTQALADSVDLMVMSARRVQEHNDHPVVRLASKERLGEGVGETWKEVALDKLTNPQTVTETTVLDNPQQFSDSALSVTPTMIGIETFVTDRAAMKVSKKVVALWGALAQNAIERKKDLDGITALGAATTALPGAGFALTSSVIDAIAARILGNPTEPGDPPLYGVLHPYQIKDIHDEIVAGVGTYTIPEGMTADFYKRGPTGVTVGGVQIYPDGLISINSLDDATGGVWPGKGLILVQGRNPWIKTMERPNIGGGGTSQFHYDEYAFAERSAGNWLFAVTSDATTPT